MSVLNVVSKWAVSFFGRFASGSQNAKQTQLPQKLEPILVDAQEMGTDLAVLSYNYGIDWARAMTPNGEESVASDCTLESVAAAYYLVTIVGADALNLNDVRDAMVEKLKILFQDKFNFESQGVDRAVVLLEQRKKSYDEAHKISGGPHEFWHVNKLMVKNITGKLPEQDILLMTKFQHEFVARLLTLKQALEKFVLKKNHWSVEELLP